MYAKIQKSKILSHSVDHQTKYKSKNDNTIHAYFAFLKNIFNRNKFIINSLQSIETHCREQQNRQRFISVHRSAAHLQKRYSQKKQKTKLRSQNIIKFKNLQKNTLTNKQIALKLKKFRQKRCNTTILSQKYQTKPLIFDNATLNLPRKELIFSNDLINQQRLLTLPNETKTSFHPVGKIFQKHKQQRCSTLLFPLNNPYQNSRQQINVSSFLIHNKHKKRNNVMIQDNQRQQNDKSPNRHQIFKILQRKKLNQLKQPNQKRNNEDNNILNRSHSVQIVTPW